jgi:hypothetical protein
MFDDSNGPAINKSHITEVVSGNRKDVPPGWVMRKEEPVKTDYGTRIDIVYIYDDGTEVRR